VITILDSYQLNLTLHRLAHQLIENHYPFTDTCFIGLQPRGIQVSDHIISFIRKQYPELPVKYGRLDITFYRDDHRAGLHMPTETDIPFSVDNKNIVLIDDVLYTGRTIRAAMDALIDFGRPAKVELLILIDRMYNRQVPIQPDYCGKSIDSTITQKVKVMWDNEPKVVLY
jgi:pyrimidine operon attenuation protein / uracil phosphoribosyltransferase